MDVYSDKDVDVLYMSILFKEPILGHFIYGPIGVLYKIDYLLGIKKVSVHTYSYIIYMHISIISAHYL